jgi:methionyl aminopeptidase
MIAIKKPEEIEILKEGGGILVQIMAEISAKVKPGINTGSLNLEAEKLIKKFGAGPAFLGHLSFPASLCTSVNEVIVHGVPGKYILKEGDIVGLDLGIKYKRLITDMAVTVPAGKVSESAQKLIKTAKVALDLAIQKVKPGNHLGDISFTIQNYVESQRFNVIRELVGHGVGYEVHEEPEIFNFGRRGQGSILKPGMVLAIEPMISAGDWHVRQCPDGSFVTRDGSLAAHFEHTVAVTKKGVEILTKLD